MFRELCIAAVVATAAAMTPATLIHADIAAPRVCGPCYENPASGACSGKEENVTITGVKGSFCSPMCTKAGACPKAPSGCTAKPECALETSGSSKPTNCALICSGDEDGVCPGTATCKKVSGTGLCTYDA